MVGALEEGAQQGRSGGNCLKMLTATAATQGLLYSAYLLLLTSLPNLIFQAEHNFHFPETVFLFPVDHHHCGKVDISHHCIGNGGIAFSFVAL